MHEASAVEHHALSRRLPRRRLHDRVDAVHHVDLARVATASSSALSARHALGLLLRIQRDALLLHLLLERGDVELGHVPRRSPLNTLDLLHALQLLEDPLVLLDLLLLVLEQGNDRLVSPGTR
eukprot:4325199-Heterocapsa_arctica.AAC.1